MSGVAQLADALRAEGGLLAASLRSGDAAGAPADEPLLATVADGSYALTLAAVREGYLLHYADGNVVDTPDADLALLGGDRLYALALAELAWLGDLDAVAALAELISDCARAHAEGDEMGAASAWNAAVQAIGRTR
ncbi:MAG TPA: hypothetical protein VFG31_09050 [Conexibacter sp.]|nr:hypothetical protein [Conexibacter sp.]